MKEFRVLGYIDRFGDRKNLEIRSKSVFGACSWYIECCTALQMIDVAITKSEYESFYICEIVTNKTLQFGNTTKIVLQEITE